MHVSTQKQFASPSRKGSLPGELRLFLMVLIATVLLSLLDALARWPIQGAQKAFSALFLIFPLVDLECYWARFSSLHTPAFFFAPGQVWTYPAPCAFIYKLLYKCSNRHTLPTVYLLLGFVAAGSATALFARGLHAAGLLRTKAAVFALTTLLLSWPIYFSLERGNIESFLWLFLAFALTLLIRGKYHGAAIALGFIAAFKIYPLLFFALFLPKKRYLQIFEGFLSLIITTVAGLYFIDNNIRRSFSATRAGVHQFLVLYSGTYIPSSNGYDHSAWALFKPFLRNHPQFLLHAVSPYTLIAGILATWFYLAKIWTMPEFNQLLAICTLMVLLPATSFDYTLQSMYIPFAWLCILIVKAKQKGRTIAGAREFLIGFALIFAPLVFLRAQTYSINGQVKAIVLLTLLYCTARFRISDTDSGLTAATGTFAQ